jgi:hypothetical protein
MSVRRTKKELAKQRERMRRLRAGRSKRLQQMIWAKEQREYRARKRGVEVGLDITCLTDKA